MAVIKIVDAVKNSMLAQFLAALDVGGVAGVIDFYTGAQPSVAGGALSGNTLLGTLTLSRPNSPTPSGGTMTLYAVTQDSSADATGVASWARMSSVATGTLVKTTVADLDVTVVGGGGALQMNTTNIVVGGPILINTGGTFSL